MKTSGQYALTALLLLGAAALSLAETPLATPVAAMPEKGEMNGDMKKEMKTSDGMMETKSGSMMEKKP